MKVQAESTSSATKVAGAASRRLPIIVGALAALLASCFFGFSAQAVGTGTPVIVTPEDQGVYAPNGAPDFVVNFSNAPYGSYDWSIKDNFDQVVYSGSIVYQAGDSDLKDLRSLSELNGGSFTATVTGTTGEVYTNFTTGVIVDPGPYACTIEVPNHVRAISSTTAVYAKFHHCGGWTVSWALRHKVGTRMVKFGSLGVKNGVSTGPWRYRDSWPTGTYSVQPPAITGPNRTQLTVKFGSRVTLVAGARTNGHFKLSGDVTRYVPSVHGFRGWANRSVAISFKNCASGCRWQYLKSTRADSHGHYALMATSSLVRYWRATVADTAFVWGSKSTAVKR